MNRRAFTLGVSTALASGAALLSDAPARADGGAERYFVNIGEVVAENDYSSPVTFRMYDSYAKSEPFADFEIAAFGENRLTDSNGGQILARNEWGIQVLFENGDKSSVVALSNLDPYLGGEGKKWHVKASRVQSCDVRYDKPGRITSIDDYEIDGQFGRAETELLKNALGYFYERFLQDHFRVMPELLTRAGSSCTDKLSSDSDYTFGDNKITEEGIMFRQFTWMQMRDGPAARGGNQRGRAAFPKVTLEYADADEDWLARARLGIVNVALHRADRYRGTFVIEVNDHYLNNSSLGQHYAHPEYWAGVIAHEALHNLGHKHLPSRSDDGYYQYQLTLIEYLVMTNGKARYGDENPTPVLCRPRPS
jgi:hypothetical protein